MNKNKKKSKIFISYAKADADKLKHILKVLVDKDIIDINDDILKESDLPIAHHELREAVKHQIQSSSKVIVIWGTSSAKSQWVNYEMGLADALEKKIIIVVIDAYIQNLPSIMLKNQIVYLQYNGD